MIYTKNLSGIYKHEWRMYEELIFIEYPREEKDFQLLMFLHEMYTRKDILAQD